MFHTYRRHRLLACLLAAVLLKSAIDALPLANPPSANTPLDDMKHRITLVGELSGQQLLSAKYYGEPPVLPDDVLKSQFLVALDNDPTAWYEIGPIDGQAVFTKATYRMEGPDMVRFDDGQPTDRWRTEDWIKQAATNYKILPGTSSQAYIARFHGFQLAVTVMAGEPSKASGLILADAKSRNTFPAQAPKPGTPFLDILDQIRFVISYDTIPTNEVAIHYLDSLNDVPASLKAPDSGMAVTIGNDFNHWYIIRASKDGTELVVYDDVVFVQGDDMVEYENGLAVAKFPAKDFLNQITNNKKAGLPFGIEVGKEFVPVPVEKVSDFAKAGLTVKPGSRLDAIQDKIALVGILVGDLRLSKVIHSDNYDVLKAAGPRTPSSPFLVTLGADTSRWYKVAPSDDGQQLLVSGVLIVEGDRLHDYEAGKNVKTTTVADFLSHQEQPHQTSGKKFGFKLGSFTVPVETKADLEKPERAGLDELTNDISNRQINTDATTAMTQASRHVRNDGLSRALTSRLLVVISFSSAAVNFVMAIVAVVAVHNPAATLLLLAIGATAVGVGSVLAWIQERLSIGKVRAQLRSANAHDGGAEGVIHEVAHDGGTGGSATHRSLSLPAEHDRNKLPQRSKTG
ncbi:hypothetical protein SeLEV6574_g08239, partial [Synchytrium endobioticum]